MKCFYGQVILVSALVVAGAVWAAQLGKVDVQGAEVFETPSKSGKVLDRLSRGEYVAASNVATEGFYKVRTVRGTVGWMSGEVLILPKPKNSDREPSSVKKTKKKS